MDELYQKILSGTFSFGHSSDTSGNSSSGSIQDNSPYAINSTSGINGTMSIVYNETDSIDSIAHAFHLASISILGILVVETLLKGLSSGASFMKRKLEMFDAFIVIVSFGVDLILVTSLPAYKIQDFVFILAFLLPWRVIRVVNSLVVSVKDHEHFRLKLMYSRKKKIQNSLRETEAKLQVYKHQCNALKKLCLAEGIDEFKILDSMKTDELFTVKTKGKTKIKIDDDFMLLVNGHGKENRKTSFLNIDGQSTPRRASLVQIEKARKSPSPSPRILKKSHSHVQNGDVKWPKRDGKSKSGYIGGQPNIIVEKPESNGCAASISTSLRGSTQSMHSEFNNTSDSKRQNISDNHEDGVEWNVSNENSPATDVLQTKTLHLSVSSPDFLDHNHSSLYSTESDIQRPEIDPSITGDNETEEGGTSNSVSCNGSVPLDSTLGSECVEDTGGNHISCIQSCDNPVLEGDSLVPSEIVVQDHFVSERL